MYRTIQLNMRPTQELYNFFTRAYGHFNDSLFAGQLAPCMITVQRQKGCMGLFYPERWVTNNGESCHELALNPTYFGAFRVVELFQTLVHEQCHMWQQEYGSPSRSGYHNREWADKMESIGLMPSDTGEPGGKRTGQNMSDYPSSDGLFMDASREFMERGIKLRWMDRFRVPDSPRPDAATKGLDKEMSDPGLLSPVTSLFDELEETAWLTPARHAGKNKVKYTCGVCGCNVWGKPRLRIRCEDCDRRFKSIPSS